MYDLQALCDKLNAANIPCGGYTAWGDNESEWSPKTTTIQLLTALPEENFGKILHLNYQSFKTFSDVIKCWGQNGYLKFDPYIFENEVNEADNNPTLAIRYNRYLHLFRRMYFQVSETPDGQGSCERGTYDIRFLLGHRGIDAVFYKESLFANMLCYAAVIDAAFVFDNFRYWFYGKPEEFENFIKKSFDAWNGHVSYGWKHFRQYFSEESDWRSTDRIIYRVHSSIGTLCEFAFGRKTVQVRRCYDDMSKVFTLRIPDVIEGVTDIMKYDTEDIIDFRNNIEYGGTYGGHEDTVGIKMLLIMALNIVGIRGNWCGFYSFVKLSSVSPSNLPNIITVNSMNDITPCEPDKY